MHYDPQRLINNVFNQVRDLLEYVELDRSMYTQIQTMDIAYTIINKTSNLQDEIKTWNRMNPIQQNWISLKTHFRTAHHDLEETGELKKEDAGLHQANLLNDIVSHMS